ncbi:MAG: restriction endonuclease subunit S [Burkholderiaceae bacterium]
MSVRQGKDGAGLPISRIETISTGAVDPNKVGYAGLVEKDCRQWLLQPGDILFSHINSVDHVGKCAVYRGVPDRLVHGMNLLCLRCAPEQLEPEFAKFLIRCSAFRVRLASFVNRAVNQASVSIGNLRTIPVEVPTLSEQRRIAEVLDRAETLRAQRRQALAQLDALAESIFLDMFGEPLINPKVWPLSKLSMLGTLDRGVSKHRPRNEPTLLGGPHPLVQTGDVANCDRYIRTFTATYSDAGLRQSRKWPAGTLCITIAANIAKTGVLSFDACFPDSVVGFTPGELATIEYVQTWLSFLQKMLEDSAPESAQKNINLAILRDLDVPLPPIELQRRYSERLAMIEQMKATQRLASEQLDALFASLQHRAFRGEL